MDKPNCYDCKHRGSVVGSAHSSCKHPEAQKKEDSMDELLSIFASVGRLDPQIDFAAAESLGIRAKDAGIRNGWFNWPWNFDPVWLTACNGFEAKGEPNEL